MRQFDAGQTRAALPFDALLPALREAFTGQVTVPPRHVHAIGAGGSRAAA